MWMAVVTVEAVSEAAGWALEAVLDTETMVAAAKEAVKQAELRAADMVVVVRDTEVRVVKMAAETAEQMVAQMTAATAALAAA